MLEENKSIIQKMVDVINRHDLVMLDEFIMPEAVYYRNEVPINGLDVLKQAMNEEIKAFPDLHVTIEDMLAEGNKVCIRLRETCTHTNDYQGISPTGKIFVMEAVPHYRIVDGKIVEGWSIFNPLNYFTQLGVIEYKGFPDEIK